MFHTHNIIMKSLDILGQGPNNKNIFHHYSRVLFPVRIISILPSLVPLYSKIVEWSAGCENNGIIIAFKILLLRNLL